MSSTVRRKFWCAGITKGLNAFESNLEGGNELLRKFGRAVHDLALEFPVADRAEAEQELAELLEKTATGASAKCAAARTRSGPFVGTEFFSSCGGAKINRADPGTGPAAGSGGITCWMSSTILEFTSRNWLRTRGN